jgi:hypothetical protein
VYTGIGSRTLSYNWLLAVTCKAATGNPLAGCKQRPANLNRESTPTPGATAGGPAVDRVVTPTATGGNPIFWRIP